MTEQFDIHIHVLIFNTHIFKKLRWCLHLNVNKFLTTEIKKNYSTESMFELKLYFFSPKNEFPH